MHNNEDVNYGWINKGITLRDYTAIEAMKALLSNPQAVKHYIENTNIGPIIISETAYKYADEMMEQRLK